MESVSNMIKKSGEVDFQNLPSQRSMMMKRTTVLEEGMQRLEIALSGLASRTPKPSPVSPQTEAALAAAREQLVAMGKRVEELEAKLADNTASDAERGKAIDDEAVREGTVAPSETKSV